MVHIIIIYNNNIIHVYIVYIIFETRTLTRSPVTTIEMEFLFVILLKEGAPKIGLFMREWHHSLYKYGGPISRTMPAFEFYYQISWLQFYSLYIGLCLDLKISGTKEKIYGTLFQILSQGRRAGESILNSEFILDRCVHDLNL